MLALFDGRYLSPCSSRRSTEKLYNYPGAQDECFSKDDVKQNVCVCGVLNTYCCSSFEDLDSFDIYKLESGETEAENQSSTNQREADEGPPTHGNIPVTLRSDSKNNISSLNLCA